MHVEYASHVENPPQVDDVEIAKEKANSAFEVGKYWLLVSLTRYN